ncbi:MAG: OmpA family protein [Rhodospirillales bacterium]|nr:OmpA family protein [Rhodospirillales bacterium]
MSRILSVMALLLAMLTSGACTDHYLSEVEKTQPRGTAFDNALARNYLAMAKSESTYPDYKDTETFARRSLAAAQGKPTLPDEPKLRASFLPSDSTNELTQARQRLVAALDQNNRTARPDVAARAQVLYDCWLEQQAEDIQPDHIKACRDGFMTALAELEKPIAAPAAPKAAVVPDRYQVFFDWNKATLTAEAQRVIGNAAQAYKSSGKATIVATGHTDTSGSAAYNMRLSVRRADAVKAELVRLGVPAANITTIGRGQEDLLVPTKDGVREPQNRRVEIQLRKTGS